jgi:spermidine/putrescine transport system permease protein
MTRSIKTLYLTAIYGFLYLPIAVLIIYSFNNAVFSATWQGTTLKWYSTLFHDPKLLRLTQNSLLLATLAASIATFLGILGSSALFHYRFWSRYLLNGLIFTLVTAPDLVFGISMLLLFTIFQFPLGFWSLLIAHITFCLPFVMVTLHSRLKTLNPHLFESAKDLGATDFIVFRRITLPLMLPALIAGWLLSFTLSIDDVIISFFVSGPNFQILPLYIYSEVRTGVTPEINALCTLLLAFTALLIFTAHYFSYRKGNR